VQKKYVIPQITHNQLYMAASMTDLFPPPVLPIDNLIPQPDVSGISDAEADVAAFVSGVASAIAPMLRSAVAHFTAGGPGAGGGGGLFASF